MAARNTHRVDARGLVGLVTSAVTAGTPARVAREAACITAKRFPDAATGQPGPRVRAYFWGVVRRRALAGAAPRISSSLIVASLARELSDAGHAPEAIRREVARLHGSAAADEIVPVVLASGGQAA